MTDEELKQQMDVEFYAATVAAWYSTALEYDKSLFTLSAGGIGLLIGLMTAVGVSSNAVLHLYVAAILFFLLCLCVLLVVFRRNKVYLTAVVRGQQEADPLLTVLDAAAMIMFGIAAVLTVIIGVSAAVQTFDKGKKTMADQKQEHQLSGLNPANESFNDVTAIRKSLNDAHALQRSFGGAAAMRPQPATTQSGSNSTSGSASQTNNSSGSGAGDGSGSGQS
ncbi:hypothetical protein NX774_05280 [Massilia agilis]|uniref:Uncharacterized protein n=1 Tax=Massilia agilis TaxID=1811226 RepID=A0ABT2D910_9BURK|nr:hypothetical protein [Massilia agilis]MCS0807334.1 hypothetical protein [Massilia agilis]